MIYEFTIGAGEDSVFAKDVFDSHVGNPIRFNGPDGPEEGILLAAIVSDDGTTCSMAVETKESENGR